LSRLEAHVKAETARPSYRDYISALKLYLIPFYGNYNVDSITPAVVTQFHQWRREHVGRVTLPLDPVSLNRDHELACWA